MAKANARGRSLASNEDAAFQIFEALFAAVIVIAAVLMYGNLKEENEDALVERDTTTADTSRVLVELQGDDPGNATTDVLRQLVVDGFLLTSSTTFEAAKAQLEALLPPGAAYTLGLNSGYGTLAIIDESGGSSGSSTQTSSAYLIIGDGWLVEPPESTSGNRRMTPGEELTNQSDDMLDCSFSPAGEIYAGDGRTWAEIWADDGDASVEKTPEGLPFGVWSEESPGGGCDYDEDNVNWIWVEDDNGEIPENHLYTVVLVVYE